jgi:putative methionine-R-sulfoxide reductase with GAF domain
MNKKFRIIAEYQFISPFVGTALYDSVESACDAVVDSGLLRNASRVWVCGVNVYNKTNIIIDANVESEICVAKDGHGVGPLAI